MVLNKLFIEAGVSDESKLNLAINCLRDAAANYAAIKGKLISTYFPQGNHTERYNKKGSKLTG